MQEGWDVSECTFTVAPWVMSCRRLYRGTVPAAGQRWGFRDDLLTIWGLRHGHAHIRSANGDRQLYPGSWLALPPGCERDQRFSADAELDSLALEVKREDGLPAIVGESPQTLTPSRIAPLLEALLQARQQWQGVAVLAQIMAVVQDLPDWRWDGFQGVDPRLARALAMISAEPCCGAVDWPRIEAMVACSRRQLDRLAQAATGASIATWNASRARERACALLRSGLCSVKQVAQALHAANASAFSHWFQRQTGHSPRQWQRLMREEGA